MLQLVYPDGEVVRFPAGGPVEVKLLELLEAALRRQELGYFISNEDTRDTVLAAVKKTLYDFKALSLAAM